MLFWRNTDETIWTRSTFLREPPSLSTNHPISEQFFNDPSLCPNFENNLPPRRKLCAPFLYPLKTENLTVLKSLLGPIVLNMFICNSFRNVIHISYNFISCNNNVNPFLPIFPFDPPENRKPLAFWCFQEQQKRIWGRKRGKKGSFFTVTLPADITT